MSNKPRLVWEPGTPWPDDSVDEIGQLPPYSHENFITWMESILDQIKRHNYDIDGLLLDSTLLRPEGVGLHRPDARQSRNGEGWLRCRR